MRSRLFDPSETRRIAKSRTAREDAFPDDFGIQGPKSRVAAPAMEILQRAEAAVLNIIVRAGSLTWPRLCAWRNADNKISTAGAEARPTGGRDYFGATISWKYGGLPTLPAHWSGLKIANA